MSFRYNHAIFLRVSQPTGAPPAPNNARSSRFPFHRWPLLPRIEKESFLHASVATVSLVLVTTPTVTKTAFS
ncbi:MAG: hypothetical protein DMG39_22745 [Acidobacteria bacterium]|nr:MAG: hypothetical protein DMG39_22745 [Acidobacteriota bacterium]